MFDKNYYEERKKKLEERYAVNKDKILGKITALLNEFWESQRDLQQDFQEIEEIIKSKELKKETKELKEAKKNAPKDR